MDNIRMFIPETDIREKVSELGKQLEAEYYGKNLLFLLVLNGSFMFAADLVRAVPLMDTEIRCIRAKSYIGTQSSGEVEVMNNDVINFKGRHVLIIEDIIDTGRTLAALKKCILEQEPASVKICTLLDKPSRRVIDLVPDYCGFQIPDEFVVGYGLDYDEKYRQLPYIGIVE